MKFFIDSADIGAIKELFSTGLIDGVTTNPTLIAKMPLKRTEILEKICATVTNGPVSAEVISEETFDMVREGEELAAIATNIVIKLPLTKNGLQACHILTNKGKSVNITLCFSAVQAILAAKVKATFVSPFIGRLDDINLNGIQLINNIKQIYSNYKVFKTNILAASIRSVNHIAMCAKAGADVATIPPKVFEQLYMHPLTDKGLQIFLADSNTKDS